MLVEIEAFGYQKGGSWLGTFLFIVLVILLLLALLGAGGYSVRRYWSPAGSEVVETSDTGYGAGAGIAAALVALLMLVVLFLGFTQWNWFGASTRSSSPGGTQTISSPAPNNGGGTTASPLPSASP